MELLGEVQRFIRAHRMPPTKFGRLAVNDPRFVFDLREGRECRPTTATRVRAFLKDYAGG